MKQEKETLEKDSPKDPKKSIQDPAPETAIAPEESVTPNFENAEAAPPPAVEEQLQKELDDAKKQLLYLQAEFQNYRKRTAKEIADARLYGEAAALDPFLTINDFLGMAKVAADKGDNIEAIRQGLEMIINQFHKALEDLGVKQIETVGKPFDPSLHEAVAKESSETVAEGIILKAWSGGYQLGEKLLRPARVVVSEGTKAESAAPEAEEKKE